MPRPIPRRVTAVTAAAFAALAVGGCAGQPVTGKAYAVGGTPASAGPSTAPDALPPGPVTLITLGDSLTAAEGDDTGLGWNGRLAAAIDSHPDRAGTNLVNLGASGWTSTDMVNGQGEDSPAELPQALDAARTAAPGAVLATVLIGSNDLWYVYQYGTENPTSAAEEDAAVATYRANLERTVTELQAAGAVVVMGLPDDQSVRPAYADITRLNEQLPDITEEEVDKMSDLSEVLGKTVTEVADAHDVTVVDTNGPFWADPAKMADDGIHPNGAGYTDMAEPWIEAVEALL